MKYLVFLIICLVVPFGRCTAQNKKAAGTVVVDKTYHYYIDPTYSRIIKNELLEMYAENKRQKRALDSLILFCGRRSADVAAQRQLIALTDSINFLKIKSITYVYGYMGPDIIGYDANQVMFNIILNRDYAVLKKYVPIIWEAFLKGNATAANYAAIADKVALTESHAQIYGSIVFIKNGSYYTPPLLDSANVDSLRRVISLPPLKQYQKEKGVN